MKFRQVTDTLLQVARQYQEDMKAAVQYYADQKLKERMNKGDLNVDARDFIPMVALMGIEGKTAQERTADIHKKMEEMAQAFENPDHSKREPYLNLLYNLVDTFDPTTVNMDSPEQVSKLMQAMLLNQTFQKKKNENLEYYNRRYPTRADGALADARENLLSMAGSRVYTNLQKENLDIYIVLTLPTQILDPVEDIQRCCEGYAKISMDAAAAVKEGAPASNTIDIPILDEMIPLVKMDTADIPTYSDEMTERLYAYNALAVGSTVLKDGNTGMAGMREAGIQDNNAAVYIDGKPFDTFLKENFPNEKNYGDLRPKVISTYMLNGRHRIDIAHTYRNEKGEMQYDVKTLRAAVTPEQEAQYLQQFSWLRRLFNWWPFRIPTLQDKLDRIAKDPRTQQRYEGIIKIHKEKVETRLARKQEEARQDQLAFAKKKELEVKIKEESSRLESTVEQWDKESVIGILGEQMIDSYKNLRVTLSMTSSEKRYDALSVLFAKQVLYTQLCVERAQNGNAEAGATELDLMGDGNPETIRKNIDDAAMKMAQNPEFKDLFLKKTGVPANNAPDGVVVDPNKFDDMIIYGGCERFYLEYMGAVKENDLKKEQQAEVQENQMDMQKQDEVKNIMA